MKRIVEICFLIGGIFSFLYILLGISYEATDSAFLIDFAVNALSIYFSVTGYILVYNNFNIKINNKANMLAMCYLLTSILTLINLILIVLFGNVFLNTDTYLKNVMQVNLLEAAFLVICINSINEYCELRKWVIPIVGSIGVAIIFCFITSPLDDVFIMKLDIIDDIAAIGVVFVLIKWWNFRRSIEQMNLKEQRICHWLYLIKAMSTVALVFLLVSRSYLYIVVLDICELVFHIMVFSYINEETICITWQKIDVEVLDKVERVSHNQLEKEILVASATEVQIIIQEINEKARELERKIIETNTPSNVEYINKIKKNCNRLSKLSSNIVSLDEYEIDNKANCFSTLNLTELVYDIVGSIGPYIEQRQIALQYITDKAPVICDVDGEAIERILLNLISNSIKYSNNKGEIKVVLFKEAEEAYLIVQDDGIGIPEHLLVSIFTRFTRVDSELIRQEEGSGLGLAIVKSLVERHQGEIKIKSKVNKGTMISIILPLKQDKKKLDKGNGSRTKEDLMRKIQIEFSDLEFE